MSKKRARTKALISVLAARFPKCFAVPDARRRPLKVGIDADVLSTLGGTIPQTQLIRALAMYCGSEGYLDRVRAGAVRVDIEGRPAGMITADDEKHAKTKLNAIRAKRDAAQAGMPHETKAKHASPPELKADGPKRLSLHDLREAARRRREGRP